MLIECLMWEVGYQCNHRKLPALSRLFVAISRKEGEGIWPKRKTLRQPIHDSSLYTMPGGPHESGGGGLRIEGAGELRRSGQ